MRATIAGCLLALAACASPLPPPDPIAERPLREWRMTGTPSYVYRRPDGGALRFPEADAIGCPRPGAQATRHCSIDWSRRTGRMIGFDVGYHPHRVRTAMYLGTDESEGLFNMARVHADQWGDQDGWGPVRGRLAGNVDGHRYWVGCWRISYGYPFDYGCTMALDLGRDGAVSSEWELREPPGQAAYALDRGQVERLAREVIAIRGSFNEPAGPPSPNG